MLMIEPQPFFSMPGIKARDTRYIDFTLTANARSQSLGLVSRMVPLCTMPAQLKSTSTLPASRATRSIAASSVTSSTGVRIAFCPSDARGCGLTSVAQPCAPSRAKARAAPRPIPCAAAVTNATLPAKRPAMKAAIILRVSMNQLDFAGRTAVVTGGAQGIGAAIVERLRGSGARVQIWDLDGSPKVDVSDPESVDMAARSALKELGKI